MLASTWLTKVVCKVKMFRHTQIAVALISVLIYYAVKPGDVMLAFVLYFILSFVVDLHAPVFWSAIAETIDYGQVKTGKRVSGFAFGGISVCQKAGMAVAGGLVGVPVGTSLVLDLGAGQRDERPFDAVAAAHGDHVVEAEASRDKRIRQHVGIFVPVAKGQRRRPFEQRRRVAPHGRPVLKAASRGLAQALSVVRTFAIRQSRICDRET